MAKLLKYFGRYVALGLLMFMLFLTPVVNAASSSEVPTLDHKVSAGEKIFKEMAEAEINKTKLTFDAIGTLPSNFKDYQKYKYIFHVTLPDSLTVDDQYRVVLQKNDELWYDITSRFTKKITDNGIDFICDDITVVSSIAATDKIALRYTAILNDKAVTGASGNVSSVTIEYTTADNKTATTTANVAKVLTYEITLSNYITETKYKLYKYVDGAKKWAVIENDLVTSWVDSEDSATNISIDSDEEPHIKSFTSGQEYWLKNTEAAPGYSYDEDQKFLIWAALGNTEDDLNIKKLELVNNREIEKCDVQTGVLSLELIHDAGTTLPESGGSGTAVFYLIGVSLFALGLSCVLIQMRKRKI